MPLKCLNNAQKVLAYRIFSIKRHLHLKIAFSRSGFNRSTALLIKWNFLFFFFRKTYYFTDPGKPRGSLSGWDKFSFRPAPGSPRMINRTYITQRYSTVIRLLYRTFCCTASTPVMFNTPVFYVYWKTKTTARYLVQYLVKVLFKGLYSYISTGVPSSRYECYVHFLTRDSVSRYKRPLRLCMRNQMLRSANAKYHFILTFFL